MAADIFGAKNCKKLERSAKDVVNNAMHTNHGMVKMGVAFTLITCMNQEKIK